MEEIRKQFKKGKECMKEGIKEGRKEKLKWRRGRRKLRMNEGRDKCVEERGNELRYGRKAQIRKQRSEGKEGKEGGRGKKHERQQGDIKERKEETNERRQINE